jgi:plastocyanin
VVLWSLIRRHAHDGFPAIPGTVAHVWRYMERGSTIPALALVGAAVLAAVPTTPVRAADHAEVLVEEFVFQPSEVTIDTGGSVTWTIGGDPDQHTVTPRGAGDFPDSGQLFEGDTYTVTFAEPGTVEYFCQLHPTMVGLVHVAAPTTPAPTRTTAVPSRVPSVAPTPRSTPLPSSAAPSAPAPSGAASGPLLAAAAVLALGVIGLFAWRARRGS